jgi:hypothetical protein
MVQEDLKQQTWGLKLRNAAENWVELVDRTGYCGIMPMCEGFWIETGKICDVFAKMPGL